MGTDEGGDFLDGHVGIAAVEPSLQATQVLRRPSILSHGCQHFAHGGIGAQQTRPPAAQEDHLHAGLAGGIQSTRAELGQEAVQFLGFGQSGHGRRQRDAPGAPPENRGIL